MIRKAAECKKDFRENMRGGDGTVEITNFVTPEELNDKGRMFSRITLQPGCGIGYHIHENESELFYIIEGEAVYNDNGTEVTISAGDVTVCPAGTSHSITNKSDKVVEIAALIVYA